jgi:hypothetical protein
MGPQSLGLGEEIEGENRSPDRVLASQINNSGVLAWIVGAVSVGDSHRILAGTNYIMTIQSWSNLYEDTFGTGIGLITISEAVYYHRLMGELWEALEGWG